MNEQEELMDSLLNIDLEIIDNVRSLQKNKWRGRNTFYQHKYWNNKLTTTAQFYISSYNLNSLNFNITNNQQLIQENKVSDVSLKINATNHIDDNLKNHITLLLFAYFLWHYFGDHLVWYVDRH